MTEGFVEVVVAEGATVEVEDDALVELVVLVLATIPVVVPAEQTNDVSPSSHAPLVSEDHKNAVVATDPVPNFDSGTVTVVVVVPSPDTT